MRVEREHLNDNLAARADAIRTKLNRQYGMPPRKHEWVESDQLQFDNYWARNLQEFLDKGGV